MRNRRNFTNFHILQFQVSRRTMLTYNTFCSSFFRFSLFQMLYSILPKFGTKYESAQAHCCGIDHKRQRIRVSFNLNSLIRNYTCLNDEFKGEYELAWDFALLVCFAKWHEKFVSWILLQIRTFFGRQSNSFSFLLFFL